jgi:hypothetical protein
MPIPTRVLKLLLGCMFLLPLSGKAWPQQLDPDFSGDGWLTEGFQPVAGQEFDIALAACAVNGGRLLVTGLASGGRRVVTLRLLEDGSLDPTFSGDGKESFDLLEPAVSLHSTPTQAVCTADGRPVVAYATLVSGRMQIVVLRVSLNGLPDGSFGTQGRVLPRISPQSDLEVPTAMVVSSEGIELGAQVGLPSLGPFGGLVRLSTEGAVRRAALLYFGGVPSPSSITAIGLFSPEPPFNRVELILAGPYSHSQPDQPTLLVLRADPANLAVYDFASHANFDLRAIGRGRAVSAEALALGVGVHRGAHVRPALVSIRRSDLSAQLVAFDRPMPIDGFDSDVDQTPMGIEAIPLPDGRPALIAGMGWSGTQGQARGLFFGVVRNGAPDTSVGLGGGWLIPMASQVCMGQGAPDLRFRRATVWNDRPTFVGGVRAAPCGTDSLNYDYWVARMRPLPPPPMFANGFE